MFTGIVKDIGTIAAIRRQGSNLHICVRYENEQEFGDLAIDESVAINGTCQTVVALGDKTFDVNTIEETLKKTTLGTFAPGFSVNLERALRPSDRLGGHFVQGHVDCVGNVLEVRELDGSREIRIGFPEEFQPFIVPIGSIAIDGVSLTVADVKENSFSVAIIPYTFENTTINHLKVGGGVNLEFDILGKYIVKQQELVKNVTGNAGKISESWLSDLGY
ncbi:MULTISPECIES: riboflavin synthase [Prosthecochloris]|uniref:Riboflavin synthase n=1 Tax=Prosthecochloris marina TaxID=2017681 RepID=A0A317T534_9CHLB|nr:MULTISPECIES: riboflavin synthase [Prosthecochloris]PWW81763.1 riboflavin synthase [Prosthecochloris marina]UZJ38459.1 riboflavin synthase [Prosthecochloris sp. SCSIO W1103]